MLAGDRHWSGHSWSLKLAFEIENASLQLQLMVALEQQATLCMLLYVASVAMMLLSYQNVNCMYVYKQGATNVNCYSTATYLCALNGPGLNQLLIQFLVN